MEAEMLAKILGVRTDLLKELEAKMFQATGRRGVVEKIYRENQKAIDSVLAKLNLPEVSATALKDALRRTIQDHEARLLELLETMEGQNKLVKAVALAKKVVRVPKGFFLKKECAEEILQRRKPEKLFNFLKVATVKEALSKYEVSELFSALRFTESNKWMHQTFEEVYSHFTPEDFEEREIEVRILGPEWLDLSQEFAAKKHHNLSHLKEFGVIFISPISEDVPGKFLRDFALFLHYFHEINFYCQLFRRYAAQSDFAEKLKSLLRGDVPELRQTAPGEWLIVQRYLVKENPYDPRLYLPRVNPESIHWRYAERDLTSLKDEKVGLDLSWWRDLDWVGGILDDKKGEVISFDLEDNAMSLVSFMEGRSESFNYHQREAMWTKLFFAYVGGEDRAEQLIINNFDRGVINFNS